MLHLLGEDTGLLLDKRAQVTTVTVREDTELLLDKRVHVTTVTVQ